MLSTWHCIARLKIRSETLLVSLLFPMCSYCRATSRTLLIVWPLGHPRVTLASLAPWARGGTTLLVEARLPLPDPLGHFALSSTGAVKIEQTAQSKHQKAD